ncbi:MAG: zinc dependent phospholipase C family protein [Lachnospiraceae bacterium]|nr:zinc dependent phospholipase C family protein [Lachnospiraceae bacterium]
MRKKTHLLLSRYMLTQMEETLPIYKRLSFYAGSILPDCLPAFLVKRHTYTASLDLLVRKLDHLEHRDCFGYRHVWSYLVNLGQVTHYLADYFTYPHNECFPGGLLDHLSYEKDLIFAMQEYIEELEKHPPLIFPPAPRTIDDLIAHLHQLHQEYQRQAIDCALDCQYIARICLEAFQALLLINTVSEPQQHAVAA